MPNIIQIYFFVIGSLSLGGGIWLLLRRWQLLCRGNRATGSIIDYAERRDLETGEPVFDKIIAFTTAAGRDIRFSNSLGFVGRKPPIGRSLPVIYPPEKPEAAFVLSFVGFWAAPLALIVLGVGGVLVGLGIHFGN